MAPETRKSTDFKTAVMEAVDEGLLTLGSSGRDAVYFHLQSLCSIKKEEISEKSKTLDAGLKTIFGVGAEVIEKAIIRNLHDKLGIRHKESKPFSFLVSLDEAKQLSSIPSQ